MRVLDVRFPTSLGNIGSDAVNKDPDYSAAYCILETDAGLEGHGLTFTLGRGNELCVDSGEVPGAAGGGAKAGVDYGGLCAGFRGC